VSFIRKGLARMSRRWRRLTVAALTLCCLGCSAAPGPLQKLSFPFGLNSKEQLLRKQVEADSFPSAKQAGL
jgi:hypothetical protein